MRLTISVFAACIALVVVLCGTGGAMCVRQADNDLMPDDVGMGASPWWSGACSLSVPAPDIRPGDGIEWVLLPRAGVLPLLAALGQLREPGARPLRMVSGTGAGSLPATGRTPGGRWHGIEFLVARSYGSGASRPGWEPAATCIGTEGRDPDDRDGPRRHDSCDDRADDRLRDE